ncbi:hypothetical protein HBB16_07190 [Pseudonocardia sp. MCCB 268]|nr:hypothetical protein [Pseudonocardia cytotoxica]
MTNHEGGDRHRQGRGRRAGLAARASTCRRWPPAGHLRQAVADRGRQRAIFNARHEAAGLSHKGRSTCSRTCAGRARLAEDGERAGRSRRC